MIDKNFFCNINKKTSTAFAVSELVNIPEIETRIGYFTIRFEFVPAFILELYMKYINGFRLSK